jgi:superfamily II DNA or RNA helicase
MDINLQREKLQTEAFNAVKNADFNAMYILPTGSGKGKVLVDIIKHLNPSSILYVCDNTNLRDVQCYQTTYKWEDKHYNLGLFDEADFACTEEYSKTFQNNHFDNMVFTSATLADDKRNVIERYAPIVYEKIISDIVEDGVVNKEQVIFVNYNLSPAENKRYLSFNSEFKSALNRENSSKSYLHSIQLRRQQYLSSLTTAKNVCIDVLKNIHSDPNSKTLIFCRLSEQADKITKYSYHSKNHKENNLQKFNDGETRVCAVVGKVDRGQNLVGVNNIIFETPMESQTKFVQKSGRGRRLDVNDTLNIWFLIPYYKDVRGNKQPTIVQKWVLNSTKDLDLSTAKNYNYG